MKRFDMIKQILDTLVNGQTVAAHGAFWRGLPLDQFKSKLVFGYPLVAPGDSANSNLVKALKAQAPFGSDVATSQAIFRRMPAGRSPARDQQIRYISDWIDAGCPDDDDAGIHSLAFAGHQDPTHHNSYWREFDNWAMYNSPPEVEIAINVFMPRAPLWFAYAKSAAQEPAWASALLDAGVQNALKLLSQRQRQTVTGYYGDPIDLDDLLDSYKRFGSGSLPPDPLRPADPNHNMNGASMWFIWAAFADACLRSGIDVTFWELEIRAVLVGLLHDGLFRERFKVIGFTPDPAGSDLVLHHARNLSNGSLQLEIRTRLAQSGF